MGRVVALERDQENLHLTIESTISEELKIDQSVSHNGACLTVVELGKGTHRVTAIRETLQKTNLDSLKVGDQVNLERCVLMNGRLDGHIVQGHVDQVAECRAVREHEGSWEYQFRYRPLPGQMTVEKGSVCVNGISLTVVNSHESTFSVFIIPYTYEHTNLHAIHAGDKVNIEFDIIGKYVARLLNPSFPNVQ